VAAKVGVSELTARRYLANLARASTVDTPARANGAEVPELLAAAQH